ncbi:MAG: phoB [Rickettsiaceae bacterium]|jgi:two-component system phosphate regulon response regulator PhoB|nr:phoB [Rickettsiaceae bacterium]
MSKHNIKPSVLVVEDDEAIVTLLHYNLEKAGYTVRTTNDGEEALIMVDESKPDLILLDWMLPGLTGIQICNRLRRNNETKNIPIIMISAKGEESDRVEGLEGGVDDYLVKPFSPRELIARINAVFRRMRPAFSEKELVYGHIKMDISGRRAFYRDEELHLGPIEYRLLQSLMEHPKRVLSRDQLIRSVWGYSLQVEPRTVDVHINRLRKALKVEKNGPLIRTIRSSGYCLTDQNDTASDPVSVNDSEIKDFLEEDEV